MRTTEMSEAAPPNTGKDCPDRGTAMINVAKRLYVCRCGMTGHIDHFYDADGEKTDDPKKAVSAVIRLDSGYWQAEHLGDFHADPTS